jgi:hypothetical protein
MSNNGNGPDHVEPAELMYEGEIWLDGFQRGIEKGIEIGQALGYDEAQERARSLLRRYDDSELLEDFERLVG